MPRKKALEGGAVFVVRSVVEVACERLTVVNELASRLNAFL